MCRLRGTVLIGKHPIGDASKGNDGKSGYIISFDGRHYC